MKKRRAETLAEFLMAALVFGIIMASTFEFIANHTEMIGKIKIRDEIMQQAQFSMDYYYSSGVLPPDRAGLTFELDNDKKTLTVSKGTQHTMTFAFKE